MPAFPQRKKIRLDNTNYTETTAICSVTICASDRASIFTDRAFAQACVAILKSQAIATGVAVFAYCFMPDHLHILISPSPRITIYDFIGAFKSLTTRLSWKYGFQGRIWQSRFYDHFLRKDEDILITVNYILNNPVRKGLVAELSQYPYSGSLVYEL